jgi:predicted enzyme related to lactoylglutathione lyase
MGVMVNSEQPTVLGTFYNQIFGDAGWHEGEWYGYDVNGGSFMVGPHSEVHGASKEPARIMIGIESSDVSSDYKRIMAVEGARSVAEPYQPDVNINPGVWLATIADPDGNYLQLSTPWES